MNNLENLFTFIPLIELQMRVRASKTTSIITWNSLGTNEYSRELTYLFHSMQQRTNNCYVGQTISSKIASLWITKIPH